MGKNSLNFGSPFTGFCALTFISCFTSAYVYLENISIKGVDDYECEARKKNPCNHCGNCGKTTVSQMEKHFFIFDTMCGHSALRCRFDDQPTEMHKLICETDYYDGGTENNIDFLFGFGGYAYKKVTDAARFLAEIAASIDAGRPLIAKMKQVSDGRFRVITGYDGDALICPDFTQAQQKPTAAPAVEELEALYIIGEKIAPRYTFKDALDRIIMVMEHNEREKLWEGYIQKLGCYTSDSFAKCSRDERIARMKRVNQTMWHTFNCHNFAEVFRYRVLPELQDPRFDGLCRNIGAPYFGYTHDLAWALIGLEECADMTKHYAHYFGEMVELTLSKIAENDEKALDAIKQIRDLLG